MANQERLSISIDERSAAEIRKLVEGGAFKTISAAFEEAATILIGHQAEMKAWWAETLRRCDEAAEHPERMIEARAFFDLVRNDLDGLTRTLPRRK
jgi:Arc/MetJ-type ribon-helix-helix transcriptional regulator